jgi:hypothetical protein
MDLLSEQQLSEWYYKILYDTNVLHGPSVDRHLYAVLGIGILAEIAL